MLELDRFVGARDPAAGNELVAQGCIFSKQLTFPGGSVHPVAGVSWVAVRAGWRRRGLLRGVMTAQLHGLHDDGAEPVAILTASEAALYGRYGYGQAINRCQLTAAHGSAFRPGVCIEPVREVRAERAHSIVPPLYSRIAATRPGYLARSDVDLEAAVLGQRTVPQGCVQEALGHPSGWLRRLPHHSGLERSRPELRAAGGRDLRRDAARVRFVVAVPARPGSDPGDQL